MDLHPPIAIAHATSPPAHERASPPDGRPNPVSDAALAPSTHHLPPEQGPDQDPASTPTNNTTTPQASNPPTAQCELEEPPSKSNPPTSPEISRESSALSDVDPKQFEIDHDYDKCEDHTVLRLRPDLNQWNDFPAMLAFARRLGADHDGCFKIILPPELKEPLPEKNSHKVPANAFRPSQIKKNSFWRVNTVPSEGTFASSTPGTEYTLSAFDALDELRKMFRKNNRKQIRNVRYRVDVPAWTPDQRRAAGVPERSPIHPLKGDKLDHTRAIIPGIHTPYVYESGPHFGASFQIHAEDFRLVSLNHLYKGRKIWIVVPSTAVDVAEEALGRKKGCSQFMRHRAEFFFPQKLEKLRIPFRIVDQRPGETIVILPDAYHEGFSTGYTIAEAKNYADANWTTATYQPCEASCQLVTAIPADLMRPLREGEVRLDLCAAYTPLKPEEVATSKEEAIPEAPKRSFEGDSRDERDTKRSR